MAEAYTVHGVRFQPVETARTNGLNAPKRGGYNAGSK
jgi:hypothetical protein